MPLLQHDTKKVNDVAKYPHDVTHSPDALRYWCSPHQLGTDVIAEKMADPFHMHRETNDDGISDDYFFGGFHN